MLRIENCPEAAASYSAERMVLNRNRGIAIGLEAPIENSQIESYIDHRFFVEGIGRKHLFLFASYIPLLLATNTTETDNSGLWVLLACCVLAFFLFGGRRSDKIKE